MHKSLVDNISELVESILADTDLFLVEIKIHRNGGRLEVWLYVDADDRSIKMDECAELSNELGFLIEAHEFIDQAYRLNVSSPGLSRSLVKQRQYPKNIGREIKAKYKAEEEYHKIEGILKEVDEQQVVIEQQQGQTLALPFTQIVEAKVIPSFK